MDDDEKIDSSIRVACSGSSMKLTPVRPSSVGGSDCELEPEYPFTDRSSFSPSQRRGRDAGNQNSKGMIIHTSSRARSGLRTDDRILEGSLKSSPLDSNHSTHLMNFVQNTDDIMRRPRDDTYSAAVPLFNLQNSGSGYISYSQIQDDTSFGTSTDMVLMADPCLRRELAMKIYSGQITRGSQSSSSEDDLSIFSENSSSNDSLRLGSNLPRLATVNPHLQNGNKSNGHHLGNSMTGNGHYFMTGGQQNDTLGLLAIGQHQNQILPDDRYLFYLNRLKSASSPIREEDESDSSSSSKQSIEDDDRYHDGDLLTEGHLASAHDDKFTRISDQRTNDHSGHHDRLVQTKNNHNYSALTDFNESDYDYSSGGTCRDIKTNDILMSQDSEDTEDVTITEGKDGDPMDDSILDALDFEEFKLSPIEWLKKQSVDPPKGFLWRRSSSSDNKIPSSRAAAAASGHHPSSNRWSGSMKTAPNMGIYNDRQQQQHVSRRPTSFSSETGSSSARHSVRSDRTSASSQHNNNNNSSSSANRSGAENRSQNRIQEGSEASSNGSNSSRLYVCFPNYSLPDLSFIRDQLKVTPGSEQQNIVISPTKAKELRPTVRSGSNGPKIRPKSLNDFENLSRESFKHIKDWDSLSVLLPDDVKQILNKNSKPQTPVEVTSASNVRRRIKTSDMRRNQMTNKRFSLQEYPNRNYGQHQMKSTLTRSETTPFHPFSCCPPAQYYCPTNCHQAYAMASCCGWTPNYGPPMDCCGMSPAAFCPEMKTPIGIHPNIDLPAEDSMEKLCELLSMNKTLEAVNDLLTGIHETIAKTGPKIGTVGSHAMTGARPKTSSIVGSKTVTVGKVAAKSTVSQRPNVSNQQPPLTKFKLTKPSSLKLKTNNNTTLKQPLTSPKVVGHNMSPSAGFKSMIPVSKSTPKSPLTQMTPKTK